MGDRDGRVGKGLDQFGHSLQVLRALEHPARRATKPGQDLEDATQVGVARTRIAGEVEIAPARDARVPFQVVGAEVEFLQLDFLVNVLGRHVVHGAQVRQQPIGSLVGLSAACEARIDAVGARAVAGRGHRFEALPEG